MPSGSEEESFFESLMTIYDNRMNLFELKLFSSIKAGDLNYLRQILTPAKEDERGKLLNLRSPEGVVITRPTSGSEVYVHNPTLLIVSVCQWFPEILDFLASFKVRGLLFITSVKEVMFSPLLVSLSVCLFVCQQSSVNIYG